MPMEYDIGASERASDSGGRFSLGLAVLGGILDDDCGDIVEDLGTLRIAAAGASVSASAAPAECAVEGEMSAVVRMQATDGDGTLAVVVTGRMESGGDQFDVGSTVASALGWGRCMLQRCVACLGEVEKAAKARSPLRRRGEWLSGSAGGWYSAG